MGIFCQAIPVYRFAVRTLFAQGGLFPFGILGDRGKPWGTEKLGICELSCGNLVLQDGFCYNDNDSWAHL